MSNETLEFIASVRINENGDDHICRHCERTFRSNRRLNQHLRSCKQNIGSKSEPVKKRHKCIETSTNTTGSTTRSSAPQKFYMWGNYPSQVFEANVSTVYEQVVYWKKNLFLLPSGKAGTQYIDETTKLMNEWIAAGITLEEYSIQSCNDNANLLLQKTQKLKIIWRL